MRHLIVTAALLAFAALPVHAEDAPTEEAPSLLERGAQMMLEGLLQEMEPALDDLQGMMAELQPQFRSFLEQMGPALTDLLAQVEDFTAYHPPEILPNGDIILRRKTPEEIEDAPETDGDFEI